MSKQITIPTVNYQIDSNSPVQNAIIVNETTQSTRRIIKCKSIIVLKVIFFFFLIVGLIIFLAVVIPWYFKF